MELKKRVEVIYGAKVEIRKLQEELHKMEHELVVELVHNYPEFLRVDYGRIERAFGVVPLRHRISGR